MKNNIDHSRKGKQFVLLVQRDVHQVVHCHDDADFEYAQMYHQELNQTLLLQKYRERLLIHLMVWKVMAPTKQ